VWLGGSRGVLLIEMPLFCRFVNVLDDCAHEFRQTPLGHPRNGHLTVLFADLRTYSPPLAVTRPVAPSYSLPRFRRLLSGGPDVDQVPVVVVVSHGEDR
jgi:hypothetical protein